MTNNNKNKRFKFGFCTWYTPLESPYAVELAGQIGYDGVQISDLGGDAQSYPMNNAWLQKDFQAAADKYGMEIELLNLLRPCAEGMLKQAAGSAGRKLGIENIQKAVDACAAMNVPALFIPGYAVNQVLNAYDLEMTAETLKEAAPYAAEKGVQLLYESFSGYDVTMRLYEKAGGCFKLCYDSLNPKKYGFGDAREELKQYNLSMLYTIHIKDCTPDWRQAEQIGKGEGDFYEIAQIIKDIGYKGWIVNENNYFVGSLAKTRDPLEIIRADLETLKKAFGEE